MNKQTRCPNCHRIYKVTVPQLTVAQGMVCCEKCDHNFNALLNLLSDSDPNLNDDIQNTLQHKKSFLNRPSQTMQRSAPQDLEIFTRMVQHSNLDLRHYLNQINYRDHQTVDYFPTLSLSSKPKARTKKIKQPRPLRYYLAWGLINFCLLLLLLFQIIWFNPSIIERNPALNSLFNRSCAVLRCENIDQRYQQIIIKDLSIKPDLYNQTIFTGELVSHYPNSLKLPLLKVVFIKDNQKMSQTFVSSEYLIESLHGITRIPTEQPYSFKLVLPHRYDAAERYQIYLIHP